MGLFALLQVAEARPYVWRPLAIDFSFMSAARPGSCVVAPGLSPGGPPSSGAALSVSAVQSPLAAHNASTAVITFRTGSGRSLARIASPELIPPPALRDEARRRASADWLYPSSVTARAGSESEQPNTARHPHPGELDRLS